MHPATEKYVQENQAVLALRGAEPRTYVHAPSLALGGAHFRKQLRATWIAWQHILKNLISHPGAFRKLASLKGAGRGRTALVLGNGPSQGYLAGSHLRGFKKHGDVFCVNRWFENEELADVSPNFVTLSDPFDACVGSSERPVHTIMREHLLRQSEAIILCPMEWLMDIRQDFGDRCVGFNDCEVRWLRNFNPMFPRGYVSMTLFKALAMAVHMDYDRIYVLGMDNTYPRNMYCAPDRLVLNVRLHAGMAEYVESEGSDVANLLFQLYLVFEDLNHFAATAGGRILNLDPYSLTDGFPKVTTIEDGLSRLAIPSDRGGRTPPIPT